MTGLMYQALRLAAVLMIGVAGEASAQIGGVGARLAKGGAHRPAPYGASRAVGGAHLVETEIRDPMPKWTAELGFGWGVP